MRACSRRWSRRGLSIRPGASDGGRPLAQSATSTRRVGVRVRTWGQPESWLAGLPWVHIMLLLDKVRRPTLLTGTSRPRLPTAGANAQKARARLVRSYLNELDPLLPDPALIDTLTTAAAAAAAGSAAGSDLTPL